MDSTKSKRGDLRKRFPEKSYSGDKAGNDESKRVRVGKNQLTCCQKFWYIYFISLVLNFILSLIAKLITIFGLS